MITAWFIDIGADIAEWGLGLFPQWDPPAWLVGFLDQLAAVFANIYGLGAWIPWPLVVAVLGATFTLWLAGLVIKAVRWIVGWIPTMGGS